MAAHCPHPPGSLLVECAGHGPVVLTPGCPDFTFGRGRHCALLIAQDDDQVSRQVGTILWASGQWWVRNDSRSHPFDVITYHGSRSFLAAHRPPAAPSRRHIEPPVLRIRVEAALGPYELTLTVRASEERLPHPTI